MQFSSSSAVPSGDIRFRTHKQYAGAAFISGLKSAVVVDIGGSSTDVGVLVDGFPKESFNQITIAGVPTNFRMPDTLSIALGGGSIVNHDAATDCVTSSDVVDLILVGGGTILIDAGRPLAGCKETVSVKYASIANAIGAALCQVSGRVEMAVTLDLSDKSVRDKLIEDVKKKAIGAAVSNGADMTSVQIVELEDIPLSYLPGNSVRLRATAVGDLVASEKETVLVEKMDIKSWDNRVDYVDNIQETCAAIEKNLPKLKDNCCAICAVEIGGANSAEPLVLAAQEDTVCLDGDLMGRAFPELQMLTPLMYGENICPTVQASDQGRITVAFNAKSSKSVEDFFRKICQENGGQSAFGTSAGVRLNKARELCIHGSVSRAWKLGKSILGARKQAKTAIFDSVLNGEKGTLLFCGKVLACVPDLICVLETDSGRPVTTEELRYGLRDRP